MSKRSDTEVERHINYQSVLYPSSPSGASVIEADKTSLHDFPELIDMRFPVSLIKLKDQTKELIRKMDRHGAGCLCELSRLISQGPHGKKVGGRAPMKFNFIRWKKRLDTISQILHCGEMPARVEGFTHVDLLVTRQIYHA